MKIPADLRRKILVNELKKVLLSVDPKAMAEVPFSFIMPTKRRFRADFYLPSKKIIIEVNGGQFSGASGGRHNAGGKGYETDLFKINLAQFYGFKVFQFTYEMIERKEYLTFLK